VGTSRTILDYSKQMAKKGRLCRSDARGNHLTEIWPRPGRPVVGAPFGAIPGTPYPTAVDNRVWCPRNPSGAEFSMVSPESLRSIDAQGPEASLAGWRARRPALIALAISF
jgi:hypothetical protein